MYGVTLRKNSGSGYTLQSPEEKSGGFSLLSLTQLANKIPVKQKIVILVQIKP